MARLETAREPARLSGQGARVCSSPASPTGLGVISRRNGAEVGHAVERVLKAWAGGVNAHTAESGVLSRGSENAGVVASIGSVEYRSTAPWPSP
jgi:hypothetical protein